VPASPSADSIHGQPGQSNSWEAVAKLSGGSYQNLATSAFPELATAVTPLDLASLGDLTNLTLSDLLGDLGVGDLASISVDPFGGLITELVDTVPQQILAAL
jgi:hypothetical protein